jgi:hypothetical protein
VRVGEGEQARDVDEKATSKGVRVLAKMIGCNRARAYQYLLVLGHQDVLQVVFDVSDDVRLQVCTGQHLMGRRCEKTQTRESKGE